MQYVCIPYDRSLELNESLIEWTLFSVCQLVDSWKGKERGRRNFQLSTSWQLEKRVHSIKLSFNSKERSYGRLELILLLIYEKIDIGIAITFDKHKNWHCYWHWKLGCWNIEIDITIDMEDTKILVLTSKFRYCSGLVTMFDWKWCKVYFAVMVHFLRHI